MTIDYCKKYALTNGYPHKEISTVISVYTTYQMDYGKIQPVPRPEDRENSDLAYHLRFALWIKSKEQYATNKTLEHIIQKTTKKAFEK